MLDHNQLTSLPTDLGKLSRLEKLSVSNNALFGLPTSISQLQKLSALDVSSNSLVELTAAVASCSQLEELNVSGNALQVGTCHPTIHFAVNIIAMRCCIKLHVLGMHNADIAIAVAKYSIHF